MFLQEEHPVQTRVTLKDPLDNVYELMGVFKKDAGSKMYFFTQWQKFCQTAARLILIERNATMCRPP